LIVISTVETRESDTATSLIKRTSRQLTSISVVPKVDVYKHYIVWLLHTNNKKREGSSSDYFFSYMGSLGTETARDIYTQDFLYYDCIIRTQTIYNCNTKQTAHITHFVV